ncbi:MAG: DUF2232 domain-containing protein [Clostridia bacterium]|nr:DUF2232 domain-containing protein [Clostridia bacterium]
MWFYQDRQYDKIDLSEVEMNGTDEKKDNVFLEVFLCMLAFLLMYLLGRYVFVTVVLAGVPFVYLAVKRNYLLSVGAYILSLGALMFSDLIYAGTVLFLTAVPVITAAYMIRNRKNVWQSLLMTGCAAVAGIVMTVIFFHYLGNGEISSYITSVFMEKAKTSPYFRMFVYSMIMTRHIIQGISVNEIMSIMNEQDLMRYIASEESFISLKMIIEEMAPNIIALFIFTCSLALYMLSKYLLKARGIKVKATKQFDEWQLPRDHGFYVLILFILGYVFMLLGEKSYQAPGQIMVYLTTYIFRLVGASYVSHMMRPMVKSKALRAVIGIAGYLILPNFVVIIGIADQVLDLRHRLFIKRI